MSYKELYNLVKITIGGIISGIISGLIIEKMKK